MKNINKNQILIYLKSKKEFFNHNLNIEKIGLFGSYAKGTNHLSSDIDLILKFKESYLLSCDPWDYFNKINNIKKDIETHFSVHTDILDEQSDSIYLKSIQKEAIYV